MSAVNGLEKKRVNYWWIKERDNPQLGTYFIACGKMSKTAAMKHEDTLYGHNTMHKFNTEESYHDELRKLKSQGKRVQ